MRENHLQQTPSGIGRVGGKAEGRGQKEGWTARWMDGLTEEQLDRQLDGWTKANDMGSTRCTRGLGRQLETDRQMQGQTGEQLDRQSETNRQMQGQTAEQLDRQLETNRQMQEQTAEQLVRLLDTDR
jgi:hypothetical protein